MKRLPQLEGPSLAGIPLLLEGPDPYIEALRSRMVDEYADWKGSSKIVRELDLLTMGSPPVAAPAKNAAKNVARLGWGRGGIGALIDREWLDSEENEFDQLVDLLDPDRTLAGARRVLVCGSGLCRIAQPICDLGSVDSVACTDLSWEMTYFGRLLAAGRYRALPPDFNPPRVFFRFHGGKPKKDVQRLAFCKPMGRRQLSKIEFSVTNAFAIHPSLQNHDTLVVPHLLDAFTGDAFETLVVRLCQQLSLRQSILIVMTLAPGRSPETLLRVLRATGYEVPLAKSRSRYPYSFSRVGFAFVRHEWNAVVVKAVRTRKPSGKRIKLRLAPQGPPPSGSGGAGRTGDAVTREERSRDGLHERYLTAARSAEDCDELRRALQRMGLLEGATELALSHLTSQGLAHLRAD